MTHAAVTELWPDVSRSEFQLRLSPIHPRLPRLSVGNTAPFPHTTLGTASSLSAAPARLDSTADIARCTITGN